MADGAEICEAIRVLLQVVHEAKVFAEGADARDLDACQIIAERILQRGQAPTKRGGRPREPALTDLEHVAGRMALVAGKRLGLGPGQPLVPGVSFAEVARVTGRDRTSLKRMVLARVRDEEPRVWEALRG